MASTSTELSRRIVALRTELGLSQEKAANLIGIPRTTLSGWERGAREPDADNLKKLADLYHCSVDYIIGYMNHERETDLTPTQQILFQKTKAATEEEAKQILAILEAIQKTS